MPSGSIHAREGLDSRLHGWVAVAWQTHVDNYQCSQLAEYYMNQVLQKCSESGEIHVVFHRYDVKLPWNQPQEHESRVHTRMWRIFEAPKKKLIRRFYCTLLIPLLMETQKLITIHQTPMCLFCLGEDILSSVMRQISSLEQVKRIE